MNESIEVKEEEKKAEDTEADMLDNAVANNNRFKQEEEKIITEAKKPREIQAVTYILKGSKILVFACFIYAAIIMYKIGRPYESILMAMAISIYLIFNKLDGG